jgi:neopullulanase
MKMSLKALSMAAAMGLLPLSASAQDATEEAGTAAGAPELATPIFADRLPEDEIIYFLLPDRFENADPSNDTGGIEGDRLDHGFDPTAKGFFQGGDLAGVMARLDYLQEMGVTAIWMAPIFKNKPVQGPPGEESAGYHGYWITDFTRPDPHFGTEEEFAQLVEEAHRRGIKVYMDIITNHTADVIQYEECDGREEPVADISDTGCPYRRIADYPWTTIGGPDGAPINEGFLGDDPSVLTEENFARLTDPRWAYTPYVPEGEEDVKVPAWLNDPTLYANRGNSAWVGESSIYGDFAGLDDVMLENPKVRAGMVEIYADWIRRYKVDGFRVDTVKHVRWDLWQDMAPAIMAVAHEEGIPHFHMFAEIYDFDPAFLARFTVEDNFPTVLDFGFQGAVRRFVAEQAPGEVMRQFFIRDGLYAGGRDTARQLPTFLGNHDMGRFSQFLFEANPEMEEEEAFARVRLAHAMMFFSRGVPTIYYGDEQGFVSDGGDQLARETMFPSRTAVYNDNDLIGTDATTAEDNFDTAHPLFVAFREMAAIRQAHPALRRGDQVTRFADAEDPVIVIARTDPETGAEYLIGFNAGLEPARLNVTTAPASRNFEAIAGRCALEVSAVNSYPMTIPATDYVICRATADKER